MQRIYGLTLASALAMACGTATPGNSNNPNSAAKTPSVKQAAQVSALFAGQMSSSASSQGSSQQSSSKVERDMMYDPNCSDPTLAMNDPNCSAPPMDPNCSDPTLAASDSNCAVPSVGGDPNCTPNNPNAANDPYCSMGNAGPGGLGGSGTQTIALPSATIPCQSGGNVVQSGNMTFSQSVGSGGGFEMSGNMALEVIYHSCAMPAPDGNTYTMNAPTPIAQNMNMTMSFSLPTQGSSAAPSFPQMTMTSSVTGDGITVYANDGSVVASGSVDLSMSINLDPNGTGSVHFSGTQFGLAVDANQTFEPPPAPTH